MVYQCHQGSEGSLSTIELVPLMCISPAVHAEMFDDSVMNDRQRIFSHTFLRLPHHEGATRLTLQTLVSFLSGDGTTKPAAREDG